MRASGLSVGLVAGLLMAPLGCQPLDEHAAPPQPETEPNVSGVVAPPPVMDGRFDEWDAATLLALDPVGDANGGFDVTQLHVASRGTHLYLHFDSGQLLNLYNGPDADGSPVAEVTLADGRLLSVNFRTRSAQLDGLQPVTWLGLGLIAAPNRADVAFEVGLDLSVVGAQIGDTLHIGLSGSDEIAAQPFVLEATSTAAERRSMERDSDALRVASLNTRESGLVDSMRASAIARLLRSAAADVICLQELGDTPASSIAKRLASTDGGQWNVHALSTPSIVGNAVASKSELIPIATGDSRFAGAIVLSEPPVAVFSVHLKCCGYLHSTEDHQRLAQATELVATIARLRLGHLDPSLAPYASAPVIVMGDFNDVGSPELEQLLTRQRPAVLSRWLLPQLVGPNVFTWWSSDESFPPALLDLVFYDPRLEPRHGWVLDTRQLDEQQLDETGLRANDSLASDHLLMVADFIPTNLAP